jgi:hypothetical protein
MPPASAGRLGPSIIARTRFFDGRVLAAISAGTGQVVILGAGYDDRALRFRSPGVRFFELDHPATQADKARRLRALRAAKPGSGGPTLASPRCSSVRACWSIWTSQPACACSARCGRGRPSGASSP